MECVGRQLIVVAHLASLAAAVSGSTPATLDEGPSRELPDHTTLVPPAGPAASRRRAADSDRDRPLAGRTRT